MFLRFEEIQAIHLVGKRIRTTIASNETRALWRSFMPELKTITNRTSSDLYSVEIFDEGADYLQFTPSTPFEKWAAAGVTDHHSIPEGLDPLTIPPGRYAVFLHKGRPEEFQRTMDFMFGTWLPESGLKIDHRPHFEVMGKAYQPQSDDCEEEIWLPVTW